MGKDRAIGIDLGTTYSCAAAVDDGKPYVIKSRLGYTTIPSVVTFDDQGQPVVGQPAERRMILQPEQTIYGSKRLIGRAYLSGIAKTFQPHFQYKLVGDDEGLVAAEIDGKVVSLVDVAAMILKEIRNAAELSMSERIHRAVVTVPAYFNENQRAAVRLAGLIAELDIIRIINEPTAAALAFGRTSAKKERLLIFDLGGGTFDVSIVDLDGNIFTVVGVDGNSFLGGIDFDRCIVDLLMSRLKKENKVAAELDAVGRERLRVAAQKAKHQLSDQHQTLVQVPNLMLPDKSNIDVAEKITRDELEEVASGLVEQTMQVVVRALDTAELKPGDIDEVLLVGGQTRMPKVQERLKEIFGKEPSRKVHPDEVVALGAAIAADSVGRAEKAELRDVVPLAIGIGEADGRFLSVIPSNTPVPHEAEVEIDIPAGCKTLKLVVLQGGRARVEDNEYLGALIIDNLEGDGELGCELTFKLDAESLLTVHAKIDELEIDRTVSLATKYTPDDVLNDMGKERITITVPDTEQTGNERPTTGHARLSRPGFFARIWRSLFGG